MCHLRHHEFGFFSLSEDSGEFGLVNWEDVGLEEVDFLSLVGQFCLEECGLAISLPSDVESTEADAPLVESMMSLAQFHRLVKDQLVWEPLERRGNGEMAR